VSFIHIRSVLGLLLFSYVLLSHTLGLLVLFLDTLVLFFLLSSLCRLFFVMGSCAS
jgi:hypothetical protein